MTMRPMISLGRRDELSAYARGRQDAADGRQMNRNWLGRRAAVAEAYRDGYEGRPLKPEARLTALRLKYPTAKRGQS